MYKKWLDIAKGIGILLVIMGHTMFPIHEAISIFHMPLFFFLAGVTLNPQSEPGHFIIKKIERIFVPYIFFSAISFIIARLIHYPGNVFNGPLWFLQTLFLAIIIVYFLAKFSNKFIILFTLMIFVIYGQTVVLTGKTMFPYDLEFDRVIRASVYVILGYLLKNSVFSCRLTRCSAFFGGVVLLIYGFLVYVALRLGAHGGWLNGDICKYNCVLYYLTSCMGIFSVVLFSKLLSLFNGLFADFFVYLGKNSLVIMSIHYPILQWWNPFISQYLNSNLSKIMVALLTYVLIVLICVPVIRILKKYIPMLTGYSTFLSDKAYE